jgi:hypothetical protein
MGVISGTAGYVLSVDNDVPIGNITSWTLDTSSVELTVGSFGSPWGLPDGGINEWSGSFEGCYMKESEHNVLWDNFLAGTPISLSFAMNENFTYVGNALIVGIQPGSGFDSLGRVGYTFKGNGELRRLKSLSS